MKQAVCTILLICFVASLSLPVQAQGGPTPPSEGAFFSGEYRNLLAESGLSEEDIQARIDQTWQQLFYGDDDTERIYYPVHDDMAYILDVDNEDVRSEGMSYGMMISVQLDKQEEFNRIWKWAKTYMYNEDGQYAGYFAWHCRPDGSKIDRNPASDGEIWFVMSLFFAAGRWGNGEGIFNYEEQANEILHTMLHMNEKNLAATNMFDTEMKQVVFVPDFRNSEFTDPSYHQPHYYELWARWAAEDNEFWAEAAQVSRAFWKTTAHPETGLMPNYAEFTGEVKVMNGYGEYFYADAWRNAMNVAVDYVWFAADPWEIEQSNRLLEFFYEQGIGSYVSKFKIDGEKAAPEHRSGGLISMNAVAGLAATTDHTWDFVSEFWETSIPSGQYRYYDGMLYMLALLHTSGQFRMYAPSSVS